MKQDEILHTVEQVAERLHTTKWTVREYVKGGQIQASLIGRRYLISESAVVAFVNANDSVLKAASTMEQHKEIGHKLATIHADLITLVVWVGNAYPFTGNDGGRFYQTISKIIDLGGSLGRARSALDSLMFADCDPADGEWQGVYYGDHGEGKWHGAKVESGRHRKPRLSSTQWDEILAYLTTKSVPDLESAITFATAYKGANGTYAKDAKRWLHKASEQLSSAIELIPSIERNDG